MSDIATDQIDEQEMPAPETTKSRGGRPPKRELFPVVLRRNYVPLGKWLIGDSDNSRNPTADEAVKARAGWKILLGVEEARNCIAAGIADRNDPIG